MDSSISSVSEPVGYTADPVYVAKPQYDVLQPVPHITEFRPDSMLPVRDVHRFVDNAHRLASDGTPNGISPYGIPQQGCTNMTSVSDAQQITPVLASSYAIPEMTPGSTVRNMPPGFSVRDFTSGYGVRQMTSGTVWLPPVSEIRQITPASSIRGLISGFPIQQMTSDTAHQSAVTEVTPGFGVTSGFDVRTIPGSDAKQMTRPASVGAKEIMPGSVREMKSGSDNRDQMLVADTREISLESSVTGLGNVPVPNVSNHDYDLNSKSDVGAPGSAALKRECVPGEPRNDQLTCGPDKQSSGCDILICEDQIVGSGSNEKSDKMKTEGAASAPQDIANNPAKLSENNDMNDVPRPVTIEEARNGIIKVILYLQAHPPDEVIQMQILLGILDYLNKKASLENSEIGGGGDSDNNKQFDLDTTMQGFNPLMCLSAAAASLSTVKSVGTSKSINTVKLQKRSTRQSLKRKVKAIKKKVVYKQYDDSDFDDETVDMIEEETEELPDRIQHRRSKRKTMKIKIESDNEDDESEKVVTRHRRLGRERAKQSIEKYDIPAPYVCLICDKGFNNPGTLTRHARIHEGKKRQVHQCAICDIVFNTARELRKHMPGHKHYVCKECGRGFTCTAHLLKHEEVHTRKLMHQCKFCKQEFEETEQLTEHTKIHTGMLFSLLLFLAQLTNGIHVVM